jgi:hypothetical protein
MKKSIGRTLAHIDVAANTSVRIHEDFFNNHSSYHRQTALSKLGEDVSLDEELRVNART